MIRSNENTENLQAKSQLISLMQEVPDNKRESIQNFPETILQKIEKVRVHLENYPDLNKDPEVLNCILKFSKDNTDPLVKKFRIKQCKKALITIDIGIAKIKDIEIDSINQSDLESLIESIPQDKGIFVDSQRTLTISEEALLKLKFDEFWEFISEQDVQSLTILQKKGQPISYGKTLLFQLYEKKPELKTLTKKYTLEFETGEKLVVPHAKLICCGKWFEVRLSGAWKDEQTIDLKQVPFDGFLGILQKVDPPNIDDYGSAVDFLEYVPYQPAEIPGIYGKTAWKKYWGNVGEVPPIPKKLLGAWNGPCPIFNKEKKADGPKMSDTHVAFYMPESVDGKKLSVNSIEEIAKSEKFGENKIGYEFVSDSLRKVNLEPEGGYWFAMLKPNEEFFKELRNKKIEDQEKYLKDNLPKEYEFPSVIEALVYCLMPYAEKKECILGRGKSYWTYTRCKDIVEGYRVVVGIVAPSGLGVVSHFIYDDAHNFVCVVPVRKFFRSKRGQASDPNY